MDFEHGLANLIFQLQDSLLTPDLVVIFSATANSLAQLRELREHFPELSKAICSRRKDYYKVRREQRILQLKDEIRQAMLEIHSQGLYPSSRRVGLLLSDPAIMRDRVISRLWREMLQELRLAD